MNSASSAAHARSRIRLGLLSSKAGQTRSQDAATTREAVRPPRISFENRFEAMRPPRISFENRFEAMRPPRIDFENGFEAIRPPTNHTATRIRGLYETPRAV